MSRSLEALIADIKAAPDGPQVAALFDLDRTLISGFSAQDILTERLMNRELGLGELASSVRTALQFRQGEITFTEFIHETADAVAGRPEVENFEFGEKLFAKRVAQRIFPEARDLVQAHREKGHTLAVVSSATPYQVNPVARDFGIYHVLCTEFEIEHGVNTGRVKEPACYGPGKLYAAQALGAEVGFDVSNAFFYSDGNEDIPLLEAVAHPVALNPDDKLNRHAQQMGWTRARFSSRDPQGLEGAARLGLTYGMMAASGWFALADYALNRDTQRARNLASTMYGELATRAAGLDLDVTGEHHLWSHRPAVFVFNHQSELDALAMGKLVRTDFTGIGKAELRKTILGPGFEAAGVIFVDRANTASAIEAMKPAVDALKKGTSIIIAPEGTRSPTRIMGPFKKGAFHLAIQAQVPMVPVVFHDISDLMPKGARTARPGTAKVTVLPPVDTSSWTRETINDHVAEVRQMYLDTLGQDA